VPTVTRYALDARTATDHFPGIGRYVFNLARAMRPLLHGDERLLVLRDPAGSSPWDWTPLAGGRLQVVDVPVSPFSPRQQWAIPRLLRRTGTALYHSPYYLMPYRPGRPSLLTVYDLIPLLFPQTVSRRARLFFRWTTALALRAAVRVVAISEATRRDLLAAYRSLLEKVVVTPLAADPAFHPRSPAEVESLRRRYALPERYVLYVGSGKPHKNLTQLVGAWSRIRRSPPATGTSLVIAGPSDPRYLEPRQRADTLGLDDVVWLGPVPEPDLPALYTGATVFVFPSLYEGFGLPVLEAMACGTPVACSNTSSLPEVTGDAALTFEPTDAASIADALAHLLGDADLRAELRGQGLRRAAGFSWERTARQTLAQYRQAVG
jgi:glycosyltransferase involved in cell wall biosynthesis